MSATYGTLIVLAISFGVAAIGISFKECITKCLEISKVVWRSFALLRPTLNEGEKNQLLPALLQVQSHNFPIQEEGLKTLQWDLFWSANQGLWRSPPDSTKQPKFLSIYNGKAPIMRWGWLSNVTFIGISTSAFLSYYRWRGYVDENQNLSRNEKHIPVPSSKRVIEVLIAILNTNFDKVFSVKLKR